MSDTWRAALRAQLEAGLQAHLQLNDSDVTDYLLSELLANESSPASFQASCPELPAAFVAELFAAMARHRQQPSHAAPASKRQRADDSFFLSLASSSSSSSSSSTDGDLAFLAELLPHGADSQPDSGKKQTAKRARRTHEDMSGYERWELEKMAATGVGQRSALIELDVSEGDDDGAIELNQQEAAFLRGKLSGAGPWRVSSTAAVSSTGDDTALHAEGTLAFAATAQSALAKERRQQLEADKRAALELLPRDLNEAWQDPLAEPSTRHLAQALRGLNAPSGELPEWKQVSFGKSTSLGQRSKQSIREQREGLPIWALRQALLDKIAGHQVIVVVGETGSGKTTQIPQYLHEAGYTAGGRRVGCTQPRRVAATSVAARVADEQGCLLGQLVGYSIRFDDCTSSGTLIKYMTDGMLLRECLVDRLLSSYSVIMLDEAHERSINTDVLFGLLKQVMKRRPDLKVIVTSATLNARKFSDYFDGAPVVNISGRTFPVDVLFLDAPAVDYLETALVTVLNIHLTEPRGDILLFLTGQEEIDTACQVLYQRMKDVQQQTGRSSSVPPLIILPVYSALPAEMQSRIFEPAPKGSRKVVIATNIAETSLTIDGIYYVVDPGFVKLLVYNPKLGMDSLEVTPVSRASADQRAGRAGRTGPGKCYRLYTAAAYETEMAPETQPELLRMNLANTVLTLKAIGVEDIDFMDPPPAQSLVAALHQLYVLGALDEDGFLTRVGRKMAEFPLEPPLSKMLLTSVALRCSDEVITVISMLSVENPFFRPKDKQAEADAKRARFQQPEGDHIVLLALFDAWRRANYANSWCHQNYIQSRAMRRAQDVRQQLLGLMDRFRLPILSCGANYTPVRKAITAGFFTHAAKRAQDGYTTLVEGQTVYVHPGSSLFHRSPDYVIYHELVLTTKEYMRNILVIEPAWLVELAPRFYRRSDPGQLSLAKRREKIQPLYSPSATEWRISKTRHRLN